MLLKYSQELFEWFMTQEDGLVKAVVLVKQGCKTCEQVKALMTQISKENEWFKVMLVDADSIPFPPPATPITYFTYALYRTDIQQPEIRAGTPSYDEALFDVQRMKRMCEEQKTIAELMEADGVRIG